MTPKDYHSDLGAELEKLGAKPLGEGDSGKWDAEPGDQLAGRVVEAGIYEGKWGEVPRLRIRVDFGTESGGTLIGKGEIRSLICSTFRLRDFFDLEQPKPGDTVLIHFAGEVPSKTGGKPWSDYRAKIHSRVEPTELEEQDESRQEERPQFSDEVA
jgi:hypothetical protein